MAGTSEELCRVPFDILGAPKVGAMLGKSVHLCVLHHGDREAHLGGNLEKVPRSAEFAHAVAPDRVRPSKCEGVIAWQVSYTSCVAAVGDKNGRRWLAGTILLLV